MPGPPKGTPRVPGSGRPKNGKNIATLLAEARAEVGRVKGTPRTPGTGRRKGSKDAKTLEKEAKAKEGLVNAYATGEMPLEVILKVMRGDETISERQFEAAVAAAPYLHPKLTAATITHRDVFAEMSDEHLSKLTAAAEWIVAGRPVATIEGRAEQAEGGEPDQGLPPLH